jgi:phage terminase large subunit-like protein
VSRTARSKGSAKASTTRDYVAIATDYAQDVVAGRILACKWTKLACERQLADLAQQDTDDFPYRFERTAAAKVCRFVELLPHIKGKWAGQPLRLEPWQCFILTTVFGWVHAETGLRRFRTAYIEVPRKNAKSTITSAVGLYMLTADGEMGAECYSAATTRDQAKIVFHDAQNMARKSPAFRQHYGVEVGAHNISVLSTASKFEALSAEGNSLDGLNIHFAAVDELHAHKTRAVYDVLETATGARSQSLLFAITTAGSNRAGICYEQRTYLTKLLDRVAADETYFGVIYTTDDGDDPFAPETWAKANPNYGVSVLPDDIARLARKAQEMPSALNNFLTKRLNVWVNADVAWMDMRAWEACADPSLDVADFEGEPCLVAYDLASKVDMAVRAQLFERDIDGVRHYYAFCRYYLPEAAVEESGNSQYRGWEHAGRLCVTDGNIIDFTVIEDELLDVVPRYEIREVPYDPFQATEFSTRMAAEGLPMVEMRPTVLNFSEPMKTLEALVLAKRFHHDGDPVLAWMVSNVVCHTDAKDNIYPRKERPENKIDGVIAVLMALGRALAQPITQASVYESEGLFTL